MERLNLLVCDLDGTLLGDDLALDEFAAWYAQARDHFRLAYSSGRFVESVRNSIDYSGLPEPDAVIGGVGTEIYDFSLGRQASMWPPSMLGWNPHIIRDICESSCGLETQPEHLLSYHKVSFYGADLDESFIEHLAQQMAEADQHVTIVYSSNRDLDILPADTHKGAAAAFLARRWNVDGKRVIVAGDSGNDASMFRVGYRGIVVGNARPELRALTAPHIYHATAPFAAGVLEGLDYWLQAPLAKPD
ncbi:MAG TPA: HAD family hydrolase [Lacipirellulaceae bacterium]